jgi:hypothetical protein
VNERWQPKQNADQNTGRKHGGGMSFDMRKEEKAARLPREQRVQSYSIFAAFEQPFHELSSYESGRVCSTTYMRHPH